MAWINFDNGDGGGDIRGKINAFLTTVDTFLTGNNQYTDAAVATVSTIPALTTRVTQNETDVGNNTASISTNAGRLTLVEGDVATCKAPPSTEYVPQTTLLPYKEGQLQYFSPEGTFVADGPTGNRLTLGHTMHLHVINNSGADILPGKAVRVNGVSGGTVQVVLAKADAYATSTIMGITSETILNGASGAVITNGEIFGIDTSALPVGVPLYLSDTVAGDLTAVAPDIACQAGGVIVSDALTGKFRVERINQTSLPTSIVGIKEATVPTAISATLLTYTPVTNYLYIDEVIGTGVLTAGTVQAAGTGLYRANINFNLAFDNVGGDGKKEVWWAIRDTGTNALIEEVKGFLLKDAETLSFSSGSLINLEQGHNYRVEIKAELALDALIFTQSSFDIESVHIR